MRTVCRLTILVALLFSVTVASAQERAAPSPPSDQEEWFYSLDGTFLLEVGHDRFTLNPGDSAFAPRRIPHVWAYVGTGPGRLLIAFSPAGQMEAFFNAVAKTNAMPAKDPTLWRAHGMEVVGPPLPVD